MCLFEVQKDYFGNLLQTEFLIINDGKPQSKISEPFPHIVFLDNICYNERSKFKPNFPSVIDP